MFYLYLCMLLLFKGIRCEDDGERYRGSPDKDIGAAYTKLRKDLQKNYDPQARPVLYNSNVTKVSIEMHLVSNFDVDEEGHTLKIDSYMAMTWTDSHLTWDPQSYEYIRVISFDTNDVWIPDIIEMQHGGPASEIRWSDFSFIILDYRGVVRWLLASSLPGRCKFKYSNYPADVAECEIVFEVWSYRGDTVDIEAATYDYYINSDNYPKQINSQWVLTDMSANRGITTGCCNYFYPSARFSIKLTRKTPTIEQQLMWISSVIVVLLTLSMFWIPSDIEQKITVGCVTLVIMVAVLLTVTSSVRTRQPLIIIAGTIQNLIFAVTTAILLEIVAINLQHIQEWKPPEFLLSIFSGTVGKILLISSAQREKPALDRMKLSEYESEDVVLEQHITTGNWKTISQALDRVAFILFVVILIAVPKTP